MIEELFKIIFNGIVGNLSYDKFKSFVSKSGTEAGKSEQGQSIPTSKPKIKEINNDRNPDYKTALGQRHKRLREEVLELRLREMTEFYEFDKVSELESYENGKNELPLESLKKLEEFFFLNPKYLELGEGDVFRSFYLEREIVSEYFDRGYQPLIVCCSNENRYYLLCYIIFYKEESGFTRLVISDRAGSFESNGGGKMNIEYLINEMLDRNIRPHDVSVLRATLCEWEAIENGTYYNKLVFNSCGKFDHECFEIFDSWYEELLVLRKKMNEMQP